MSAISEFTDLVNLRRGYLTSDERLHFGAIEEKDTNRRSISYWRVGDVRVAYDQRGARILTAEDAYKQARYLDETPYASITEWSKAKIDLIPPGERCQNCGGRGKDVIRASNGGVGEIVRCWPCDGTGRRRDV